MELLQMHNPPHPGEVIRELCLEPLELSVTEAAEGLGVSRKTLSAILNGHAGISPEMALRLSMAFDTTPVKIEVGAIGGEDNATFTEIFEICVNEVEEGCD
jgi:addiction module HigA family antidote